MYYYCYQVSNIGIYLIKYRQAVKHEHEREGEKDSDWYMYMYVLYVSCFFFWFVVVVLYSILTFFFTESLELWIPKKMEMEVFLGIMISTTP